MSDKNDAGLRPNGHLFPTGSTTFPQILNILPCFEAALGVTIAKVQRIVQKITAGNGHDRTAELGFMAASLSLSLSLSRSSSSSSQDEVQTLWNRLQFVTGPLPDD